MSSIADKVRAAADYDTWKQEQIRSGSVDHSVDDYERHLRHTLTADRLDQINELVTPIVTEEGWSKLSPGELWSALQRIATLSDLTEENQ